MHKSRLAALIIDSQVDDIKKERIFGPKLWAWALVTPITKMKIGCL